MRSWTDADQALLYTCHLAADLLAGRPMRPAPVRAPFPPRYSVEETYLASGPFTLSIHAAPGDGSYMHDSSFFFATGRGGLAATAGFAAVRAMGNSRRRAQAQEQAIARWLPRHAGEVTVSDHGMYLRNIQDFFAWDWHSIDSAEVVAFNTVILAAPSTQGTTHWLLQSQYAELVFLLWAKTRYPGHPQLQHHAWLPPNWAPWATAQGHRPALGIDPA
jgi:hypothetical protein